VPLSSLSVTLRRLPVRRHTRSAVIASFVCRCASLHPHAPPTDMHLFSSRVCSLVYSPWFRGGGTDGCTALCALRAASASAPYCIGWLTRGLSALCIPHAPETGADCRQSSHITTVHQLYMSVFSSVLRRAWIVVLTALRMSLSAFARSSRISPVPISLRLCSFRCVPVSFAVLSFDAMSNGTGAAAAEPPADMEIESRGHCNGHQEPAAACAAPSSTALAAAAASVAPAPLSDRPAASTSSSVPIPSASASSARQPMSAAAATALCGADREDDEESAVDLTGSGGTYG
jgi:hypothetical protein